MAKARAALDEAQNALTEPENSRQEIEAQSLASARADITALLALRVQQLSQEAARGVGAAATQPTSKDETQEETPKDLQRGAGAASADPLELIKRLGELREAGLLTDEEFVQKKTELLGRL